MNNTFIERFDSLSTREKLMLICAVLITLWGGWDAFVYQPFSQQKKQLNEQLSTLNNQLSANQIAIEQIKLNAQNDLNQNDKQKLKSLQQELKQLKSHLDDGIKKLVSAQQVTSVLHKLFKQNTGLKLKHVETLSTEPLLKNSQHNWIFQHGLSITWTSHYFNALRYLQALEALPWKFHWHSLDYQVTDYPEAEITLKIYTLSFEEKWLGL